MRTSTRRIFTLFLAALLLTGCGTGTAAETTGDTAAEDTQIVETEAETTRAQTKDSLPEEAVELARLMRCHP